MEGAAILVLFGAGFVLFLFGLGGGYVSGQKGRPDGEGFILGILLGPIGILIAACMPTIAVPAAPASPAGGGPVPSPSPRPSPAIAHDPAADEARRKRVAEAAAADAQREKRRAAAAEARRVAEAAEEAAREKRRAEAEAERARLIRARGGEPGPWGWFYLLPDGLQVLVMAAGFTVPAVGVLVLVVRGL